MYTDDIILGTLTEFNDLRKESQRFSSALSQYKKKSIAQFKYDYLNRGLKGKEVYDRLMSSLDSSFIDENSEGPVTEIVNTVFPSSFDENEPVGVSFKKMIEELNSYLGKMSVYNDKYRKQKQIVDLFFNEHLSLNEIKSRVKCSMPTIKDNFLSPLFNQGKVNDISILPSFFSFVNKYISAKMYFPYQTVRDEVQLEDSDFKSFLYVFGAEVFEKAEYCQPPIIIHKGDKLRADRCIYCVFDVLSDAIVPTDKKQIVESLKKTIEPDEWLPEYIEVILSTNASIQTTPDGLLYLSDDKLKSVLHRVCRIIYNAPNQVANKDYIRSEYTRLYKKEFTAIKNGEMREKHFFTITDGCYRYLPNEDNPVTVHQFIDNYISTHVLFKWSDLLTEIKKINPILDERSERGYTTNKCLTCRTDSDILVLEGHEDQYPQFSWNAKRKMDKTNFFINQAVEILKKQSGCEMEYKSFRSQLDSIIRSNGYSDHTIGTVITQYTDSDPKIFIRDNNKIKLDEDVLADVALDYIGLGYKHADFYISVYALAISELKSRPDHKMLRSEITALAKTQISEDIDGKIVNKAFADRAKPDLLLVEGKGSDTYICLDMTKLASEVASDKQYKVATDSVANQNDPTPSMVIDTKTRPDTTYRQVFNWNDIIAMMKKDLKHYDKPFFYLGISSDEVIEKFHKFMSQSRNIYLNTLIPQAYYELSYANVDRWSSYDYRSKMARAFESLLMDIYYQNRGVESRTKGLKEIMDLAFPDYWKARKSYDRSGFNGILNDIYNDRINFAHPTTSDMPTLLSNIKAFISYLALYVFTVDKYYKG